MTTVKNMWEILWIMLTSDFALILLMVATVVFTIWDLRRKPRGERTVAIISLTLSAIVLTLFWQVMHYSYWIALLPMVFMQTVIWFTYYHAVYNQGDDES